MPIASYARSELFAIWRDVPDLVDVAMVAALTGSHERTVRRWLADGRLKGLQKGPRSFLIPKKCVVDFLTNAGGEGTAGP